MGQFRYFVQAPSLGGGSPVVVNPIDVSEIDFEKPNDEYRADYEKKIGNNLKFINDPTLSLDYDLLIQLECSCEPIDLIIEHLCQGEWTEFFRGKMSMNKSTIDKSNCVIELKPVTDDCLEDGKDNEANILSAPATDVFYLNTWPSPQNFLGNTAPPEFHNYGALYNAGCPNVCNRPLGAGPPPIASIIAFCPNASADMSNSIYPQFVGQKLVGGILRDIYMAWMPIVKRKRADACPVSIAIDGNIWLDIPTLSTAETCTFGYFRTWPPNQVLVIRQFALQPAAPAGVGWEEFYDPQVDDGSKVWVVHRRWQVNRARDLSDALLLLAQAACPDITEVVSDFFQINPENPSGTNYVTGLPSKVDNIKILQRSDAKRPQSSEPATNGITTFNEFFRGLHNVFHVKWARQGNSLRVEHQSFFEASGGFNYGSYPQFFEGLEVYENGGEDLPASETWISEDSVSQDFLAAQMRYVDPPGTAKSNCVGKENVDRAFTPIYTDFEGTLDNEDIGDKGFVLLACDANDDVYFEVGLRTSAGTPPGVNPFKVLNTPLSPPQILRDWWLYRRPHPFGYSDSEFLTMNTVKRTRKLQEDIEVPFCCPDTENFAPEKTSFTPFGEAEVAKASVNPNDCTITTEFFFDKCTE